MGICSSGLGKSEASVKASVPWERRITNQIGLVVWVPAFHWKEASGGECSHVYKP